MPASKIRVIVKDTEGTQKGKIDLHELVRLRTEYCMTQTELAEHFGVTQKGISKMLKLAEEKGLYDKDFSFTIVRKDENGEIAFLTEKEFDSEKPNTNIANLKGDVRRGRKSKYRCLKCQSYLVPLKGQDGEHPIFTHKNRPVFYNGRPVAEVLVEKGFSHLCPNCLIAYAKEEKTLSDESVECPKCGEELTFLSYNGTLTDLLYCPQCKKGFKAGKEEFKKIQRYAEKLDQRKTKGED